MRVAVTSTSECQVQNQQLPTEFFELFFFFLPALAEAFIKQLLLKSAWNLILKKQDLIFASIQFFTVP